TLERSIRTSSTHPRPLFTPVSMALRASAHRCAGRVPPHPAELALWGELLREVDALEPEAGGVHLGRRGQFPGRAPQPVEALVAGPFEDAANEGRAPVEGGLAQFDPEHPLHEALALPPLHPPPAQRL